ncbi:DNL-type zinc finger protein [Abrus precatorius]|uniref:DNL-type zinc finger protein n=1 Tax=Abrus precatorius TaxID=3816 RepID=A0A8B8MI48_ABRPR|nr:DNL-type zinc finger protein [Abrus precatorius]
MAMAARMLQRRFISIFSGQTHHPILQGSSRYSPASAILNRYGFHQRGVTTHTTPIKHVSEDVENKEDATLKSSLNPDNVPTSISINENSAVKFSAHSSLKTSSRHDLAMVFTCKVCETRSIKTVCRQSYEKGVVVARCGGCNNLHLIADHLGWFGEPGSIEDFLASRGEEVKRGSVDTLNLTLEDIAGRKP